MKALLDTHVFLWWVANKDMVSELARKVISNGANELYFSVGSGWEIAIKMKLGKITLPEKPERFIAEQLTINAIQPLPILMSHALHVYNLPKYHRDPFDRILIAQSQLEEIPIITADPKIAEYDIQIIW